MERLSWHTVCGTIVGMTLVSAARRVWEELAHAPGAFDDGVRVVVSPDSLMCPPGCVGAVVLGGGALVTAPDESTALSLRPLVATHGSHQLTEPTTFAATHAVSAVLGPAHLGLCWTGGFSSGQPRAAARAPAAVAGSVPHRSGWPTVSASYSSAHS